MAPHQAKAFMEASDRWEGGERYLVLQSMYRIGGHRNLPDIYPAQVQQSSSTCIYVAVLSVIGQL